VLDLGVQQVILGTVACRVAQLVAELCRSFQGQIVGGIDAVTDEEWQRRLETSEFAATGLADAELGAAIIYTDIIVMAPDWTKPGSVEEHGSEFPFP